MFLLHQKNRIMIGKICADKKTVIPFNKIKFSCHCLKNITGKEIDLPLVISEKP